MTELDGGRAVDEDSLDTVTRWALQAYARALHLSCLAAARPLRDPTRAELADRAIAAHVSARSLAEEVVRRAGAA